MYQVLARKWRPKNFHQLVGQAHVTQALTYALDNNRIHHAYLFTGTRGVGKTTIARIFAKSLNCLPNGVSSNPCGQCEHCLEIEQGRFPDLIEVDAASRTGVDDTRELLDNVPYAPVKGRFKVYLIDEVHMFSKSSFNALLKTLEEPPAHVKFILATTDPQKLPMTVLSRCLQFHLKNMTEQQIAGHLATVLATENIPYEADALLLLASAAAGSMRDSLSLLDQAIAYGKGQILTNEMAILLGAVAMPQLLNLLETIVDGDARAMRVVLQTINEYAPDHSNLLQSLLQCLQKITILQLNAQGVDEKIDPKLQQLAGRLPVELVQLWYQITTDTWQHLPYQPDPQIALEMGLLRMIALRPLWPKTPLEKLPPVPQARANDDIPASLAEIVETVQPSPTPPAETAAVTPAENPSPENELPSWVTERLPDYAEMPPPAPDDEEDEPEQITPTKKPVPTETMALPPAKKPVPQNEIPPTENTFAQIKPVPTETMALPPAKKPVPQNETPPTENTFAEIKPVPTETMAHLAKKPVPQNETPPTDMAARAACWQNDLPAWSNFVAALPIGAFGRMLLENCVPQNWHAPILTLAYDDNGEIYYSRANQSEAEKAITAQTGEICQLHFVRAEKAILTPILWQQQTVERKKQEMQTHFLAHPLVQAALAAFGSEVKINDIQSTINQE